jgi:transposase
LYGRSSEKTANLPFGIEQLSLFDDAETEANRKAPEPDLKQVEAYQRKRKVGDRAELLKDIPHHKLL